MSDHRVYRTGAEGALVRGHPLRLASPRWGCERICSAGVIVAGPRARRLFPCCSASTAVGAALRSLPPASLALSSPPVRRVRGTLRGSRLLVHASGTHARLAPESLVAVASAPSRSPLIALGGPAHRLSALRPRWCSAPRGPRGRRSLSLSTSVPSLPSPFGLVGARVLRAGVARACLISARSAVRRRVSSSSGEVDPVVLCRRLIALVRARRCSVPRGRSALRAAAAPRSVREPKRLVESLPPARCSGSGHRRRCAYRSSSALRAALRAGVSLPSDPLWSVATRPLGRPAQRFPAHRRCSSRRLGWRGRGAPHQSVPSVRSNVLFFVLLERATVARAVRPALSRLASRSAFSSFS